MFSSRWVGHSPCPLPCRRPCWEPPDWRGCPELCLRSTLWSYPDVGSVAHHCSLHCLHNSRTSMSELQPMASSAGPHMQQTRHSHMHADTSPTHACRHVTHTCMQTRHPHMQQTRHPHMHADTSPTHACRHVTHTCSRHVTHTYMQTRHPHMHADTSLTHACRHVTHTCMQTRHSPVQSKDTFSRTAVLSCMNTLTQSA